MEGREKLLPYIFRRLLLEPQDEGPDVFVHYSAIAASGFKSLTEGDQVEFEVTQGPKGPQAQAVKKLTPATR